MIDLKRLKSFEQELDEALLSRPSLTSDAASTRLLALNMLDAVWEKQHNAEWFRKGLSILLPHFGAAPGNGQPSIEELLTDIVFASHYYSVRESLYYTYNVPGALKWTFSDKEVTIRFRDKSIPRQFYHMANGYFIGAIALFRNLDHKERIESILRTTGVMPDTSAPDDLSRLITAEIELKLRGYYALLDESINVQLGRYTYAEFVLVYKHLLGNALIHRYRGRMHDSMGAVIMERPKLVAMVAEHSGLSEDTCAAVIADMTYPESMSKPKEDPVYFALYALPGQRLAMVPSDFLMHEGIVSALRLSALRDPVNFLNNLSGPLGGALADRVRLAFEKCGFACRQNVALHKLDAKLPDIDLVVISEEMTLGYVVYLCEIKNPLPAFWAKDQLRVLNKDSVAKAFKQLDDIAKVMVTAPGVELLRSFFPATGLPHLKEGYLVSVRTLIVTSQNAGMFFSEKTHTVVDYRTLERILESADGDVTYIDRILRDMNEIADKGMKVVEAEFQVGNLRVRHQGVSIRAFTEFTKNEYKSAGTDIAILKQFIKDGASPFDAVTGGGIDLDS